MIYGSLISGIFAVCIACACWAYAFVVPLFLDDFSPTQITIFRYFFYGLFSLVLFMTAKKPKQYSLKFWMMAFLLGLIGNVLYYYFLILGITIVGPEIAIPIGGMMPVTVALLGNIMLKEFPLKSIAIPLFITFFGLLFVNYIQIPDFSNVTSTSIFGLIACFIALGLWTWYGVINASFLKKNLNIDASTWTNMIGMMTLLQVFLWGGIDIVFNTQHILQFNNSNDFWELCFWTASLGVISSWLGTMAWNKGAIKLPVTLAGQFIVMEPIFGLVYIFLLKHELPGILEFIGFSICIFGILLTLQKIQSLKANRILKRNKYQTIT